MEFPASARKRNSEPLLQKVLRATRLDRLRLVDLLIPVTLLLIGLVMFWSGGGDLHEVFERPKFQHEHHMIAKGLEQHTEEKIAEHAMKMIQERMWQQDAVRLGHASPEDFDKAGEPEQVRPRDDPEGLRHANFSPLRLAGQALLFFGGAFGLMAVVSSMWVLRTVS